MYNELLAFTTVPIIQGFYIIVNPIINVFSGMIYVKCKKQVENAKNWKIMKKSAKIVNTAAMPAAALEKAGDRGYNVYGGFFLIRCLIALKELIKK